MLELILVSKISNIRSTPTLLHHQKRQLTHRHLARMNTGDTGLTFFDGSEYGVAYSGSHSTNPK